MKKLLYLTIGTLLIYSCSKEDITSQSSPLAPSEAEIETTDGMTVLGSQLENPYSVNNMRRALANLVPATRSGIGEDQIQATHHYVKFHPKTNAELDLLKQDSTILLYEYPLDYDIEVYGTYYHSPEIPDSQPTYQYASIDVEKWDAVSKIPVEFTILEELFIPDEDKDDAEPVMTRSGKVLDYALIDALVDEALKITGNEDSQTAVTRARNKWRPAGQITYYDEAQYKTIGMEGVRIRARRWFTTHTGISNTNGDYSCDGRFKRPANYSFYLDRSHFEICFDKNAFIYQVDGPKKTGNWNYSFSRSRNAKEYFMATVFRACLYYCYKNIEGIGRPPQSNFLRSKIKLYCMNENHGTLNGQFEYGTFIISSKCIQIYNPHNRCDAIYATTIHELAHSAHWRHDRSYYQNKVDKIVKETWASGVEVYLTRKVYPSYFRTYNRHQYTGLIEDLMDGVNHVKTSYFYDWNTSLTKSYTDNVSGYSIKQIETAMLDSRTFNDWKNRLKSKYPANETKNNLDAAFTYWSSK